MLQDFEQGRNGLPGDCHRVLQGPVFGSDTIDAAVLVIAVGIPHIVLHVPDDDIVPVGDIHGAVGAEDDVGGAEILVGTDKEIGLGRAPHMAVLEVAFQGILLDAEVADGVANEEITLHVLGEMCARNDLVGGHGANFLFQ